MKAGYKTTTLPGWPQPIHPSGDSSRGGDTVSNKENVKGFWESHVNNEYYTSYSRSTKEYFDDITEKRYRYHYHLPKLFRRMGSGAGRRLLEVGCGIGIDTVSLARRGYQVTAVDLTESAIEIARKRAVVEGLEIDYRTGDGESLDFDEATFDVVYSFGVIHHTPDMEKAVREIHRVLKPGGRAYVMVYARHSLVNFIHAVFSIPYESPRNLRDHCPVVIRSTKRDLRRLFSGFGSLSIHKDYPFTYGMRALSRFVPVPLQEGLGRVIGWHLMIEAEK